MARNGPIRDQRRQELIRATIAVIARHGYSGTTVARVARKAKVAVGLISFHFESKDRLFRATFEHLAAETEQVWQQNLAASGLDPAARLGAMIETYFDPRLFTRDKLAAWFTFWSDAELRERYRAAAMRLERRYTRELERELRRLLAAGGLDLRSAPPIVATLAAMIDGFWLQAMLNPRDFDREAAVAACIAFLELRLSRVGASPRPRRRAQPSVASAGLARIERPG